jgi:hypothetical protein
MTVESGTTPTLLIFKVYKEMTDLTYDMMQIARQSASLEKQGIALHNKVLILRDIRRSGGTITRAHFGTMMRLGLFEGVAVGAIGMEALSLSNTSELGLEGLSDHIREKAREWASKIAEFASKTLSKIKEKAHVIGSKVRDIIRKIGSDISAFGQSVGRKIKAHPMKTALAVVGTIVTAVGILTMVGKNFPQSGSPLSVFNKWNDDFNAKVASLKKNCPWENKDFDSEKEISEKDLGISKSSIEKLDKDLDGVVSKTDGNISSISEKSKAAEKEATSTSGDSEEKVTGTDFASKFMSAVSTAILVFNKYIIGGMNKINQIVNKWKSIARTFSKDSNTSGKNQNGEYDHVYVIVAKLGDLRKIGEDKSDLLENIKETFGFLLSFKITDEADWRDIRQEEELESISSLSEYKDSPDIKEVILSFIITSKLDTIKKNYIDAARALRDAIEENSVHNLKIWSRPAGFYAPKRGFTPG